MIARRAVAAVGFTGLALFLQAGCSSYRLGSGGEPEIDSVYVAPVINDSEAPQAVVPFTRAIKESFLTDGRVEVAGRAETADGILEVRLTNYERFVAATQAVDTALGQSFRTVLHGRATLRKADGTVLLDDRYFRVESSVLVEEDLVQSEYQNMPVLTRELAERIRDAVLDTW